VSQTWPGGLDDARVRDLPAAETLVLLTACYPFGQTSETFLDAELPILVRRFARVLLLPSRTEPEQRPLPIGARVLTLLTESEPSPSHERLPRWERLAAQFIRALFEEGRPACYLRHARTYLQILDDNLHKYRLLRTFIEREGLREATFYDYWLENSTLALAWLRREGIIRHAVARAHGFDLYDERWPTGVVPYRTFKVASLDQVFTVSQHGLNYLANRLPAAQRSKLVLSRLGVTSRPFEPIPASDSRPDAPLVVSCARLFSTKRVDQIPLVLAHVGRPLRWVHFGDGPARADVERAAAALRPDIDWRLAGRVDHDQLMDFYASSRIDLFLSLSATEGLPVSIMEAISFGVPVAATAVGGVPEIVTPGTGRLVQPDDSPDRVAQVVKHLLDGDRPSREQVRAFFEAHFDAERNFNLFADLLHAL
jgi:glycosyltransferase involved in cell wall biosynthesis